VIALQVRAFSAADEKNSCYHYRSMLYLQKSHPALKDFVE
jgi:hypothetical protein